ncbi:MAG TPA: hypothetical protein PL009_10065 [Flavipsychrobacter sp.]|nr:hypothetical protein [Flavipsychrobacter sp.]
MKSLRRVLNQIITAIIAQTKPTDEHLHLARAYRPVSRSMMPRWRNIGTAITPYHFMRPALIPVQQQPQRNIR